MEPSCAAGGVDGGCSRFSLSLSLFGEKERSSGRWSAKSQSPPIKQPQQLGRQARPEALAVGIRSGRVDLIRVQKRTRHDDPNLLAELENAMAKANLSRKKKKRTRSQMESGGGRSAAALLDQTGSANDDGLAWHGRSNLPK